MARKILFIAQEIAPFVPDSYMSTLGKILPRTIQDQGNEIRIFHPKWGNINERRNQLHEVIRLSGMNIIIDEADHPLLIKVASLQAAKMQVYFIDNEDFFFKRLSACDKDGVEYNDNYERAVFYARSVLETIKKLRWYPEAIVCQGWISAIAPFYIKTVYKDEPAFDGVKVITSLHKIDITKPIPERFPKFLAFRNVTAKDVMSYDINYKKPVDMVKLALKFSDAAIIASDEVAPQLKDYAQTLNLPTIQYSDDNAANAQALTDLIAQL